MRSFPASRFGPMAARTLVEFQNLLAHPDRLRRNLDVLVLGDELHRLFEIERPDGDEPDGLVRDRSAHVGLDRKSTRLNSSHGYISYAVFCLKKKKNTNNNRMNRHT